MKMNNEHIRAMNALDLRTQALLEKARTLGPRLNGFPATIEASPTRIAKMVRVTSGHQSALFPIHIAEIAVTRSGGNFLVHEHQRNLAALIR